MMSAVNRSRHLVQACRTLCRGYWSSSSPHRLLRVSQAKWSDIKCYSVPANQKASKKDAKSSTIQSATAPVDGATPVPETDQSDLEDITTLSNDSGNGNNNIKTQISNNGPVSSLMGQIRYIVGSDMDKLKKDEAIVRCLKRLSIVMGTMKENDKQDVIGDRIFSLIEVYVGRNVGDMGFSTLEFLLKFFMKLYQEDTELLETLLHEAVWRTRTASSKETFVLLDLVEYNHSTAKRNELYQVCKTRVQQNLGQIDTPKDLITAMYLLQKTDSQDTKQQLDELALTLVGDMNSIQIYRIIYLMAKNRTRNFVLLKRAAYQLCKRPLDFDEIKLKNLFFACDVLHLQHNNLLEEMSVNLLDKLANGNGDRSLTVSLPVMTSCSKLGWSYTALTQCLLEDLQQAVSVGKYSLTSVQSAGLIMSLGRLNLSEYGEFALKLFEGIGELKVSDPGLWLNAVYSMAQLKRAPMGAIQEVLQPVFYVSLLESMKDKPAYQQALVKSRILNLNGCLQVDLGGGEGLPPQEVQKFTTSLQDMIKQNPPKGLVEKVAPVLTNLAPLEKYVNRNVIDNHGHKIDFEFFVDKDGKAKRLENSSGMTKMGVRVLNFQEMVRGDKEPRPNGTAAMSIRHLSAGGHLVVMVPYHEWAQYKTKIAQTQYLEGLVKKAVGTAENKPSIE